MKSIFHAPLKNHIFWAIFCGILVAAMGYSQVRTEAEMDWESSAFEYQNWSASEVRPLCEQLFSVRIKLEEQVVAQPGCSDKVRSKLKGFEYFERQVECRKPFQDGLTAVQEELYDNGCLLPDGRSAAPYEPVPKADMIKYRLELAREDLLVMACSVSLFVLFALSTGRLFYSEPNTGWRRVALLLACLGAGTAAWLWPFVTGAKGIVPSLAGGALGLVLSMLSVLGVRRLVLWVRSGFVESK